MHHFLSVICCLLSLDQNSELPVIMSVVTGPKFKGQMGQSAVYLPFSGGKSVPALYMLQASRKLFATRRTKCPANLRFFAGHFRVSPDIFKLRMAGEQRFIFSSLDILSGDLVVLRRTFSKFAGHVRRVRRISGSLNCYLTKSRWAHINVFKSLTFLLISSAR